MPYLIRVGVNPENVGGMSSKGYCIWREGTSVCVEYGAVDTDGKMGGQWYWRTPNQPNSIRHRFRSVAKAEEFKRQQLAVITGRIKKYERLAPGRIIKSYKYGPMKRLRAGV